MATSGPRRAATSGGRKERSTETRAALVAGAIEALREVGFAGASAREIARRAGCNQALVFYHFGSVTDLLLAALDDVSARRLAAYADVVDRATTLTDLIDSARAIFGEDLDAGHVAVLVEMITGAQSTPGLGEQVAARLAPWRDFAESAVRRAWWGRRSRCCCPPRSSRTVSWRGSSAWSCWRPSTGIELRLSRCSIARAWSRVFLDLTGGALRVGGAS